MQGRAVRWMRGKRSSGLTGRSTNRLGRCAPVVLAELFIGATAGHPHWWRAAWGCRATCFGRTPTFAARRPERLRRVQAHDPGSGGLVADARLPARGPCRGASAAAGPPHLSLAQETQAGVPACRRRCMCLPTRALRACAGGCRGRGGGARRAAHARRAARADRAERRRGLAPELSTVLKGRQIVWLCCLMPACMAMSLCGVSAQRVLSLSAYRSVHHYL
jgi:hypothetical protein